MTDRMYGGAEYVEAEVLRERLKHFGDPDHSPHGLEGALIHLTVATLTLEVARACGLDVDDALEHVLATFPPNGTPTNVHALTRWYERAIDRAT